MKEGWGVGMEAGVMNAHLSALMEKNTKTVGS